MFCIYYAWYSICPWLSFVCSVWCLCMLFNILYTCSIWLSLYLLCLVSSMSVLWDDQLVLCLLLSESALSDYSVSALSSVLFVCSVRCSLSLLCLINLCLLCLITLCLLCLVFSTVCLLCLITLCLLWHCVIYVRSAWCLLYLIFFVSDYVKCYMNILCLISSLLVLSVSASWCFRVCHGWCFLCCSV